MSKFILVHDASNGSSPIIINTECIAYAEKSELLTGATYIQLNDLDCDMPSRGYHVAESPEKLIEMLN